MKIKKFNENTDSDELMKQHLDDDSIEHYKEIKYNIHSDIRRLLFDMKGDMEEYTQGAEGEINLNGEINTKSSKYTYEIKITRVE